MGEGGARDSGGESEAMGVCRETKLICSQSISFLSVKSALQSLSAPSSIYLSIYLQAVFMFLITFC